MEVIVSKAFLFAALLILVPVDAAAQGYRTRTIPDAVSAGVSLGISGTGNSWSGGGEGPLFSGRVDIPARDSRVRLAIGHVRWTPTTDVLTPGAEPAGRVGLSRATASLVVPRIEPSDRYPFGIYVGGGVGYYRYHMRGVVENRVARGLHGLAGFEYVTSRRRRVLHVEFELHAIGGPGHAQVWATTVFAGSAAVGISRRF
jgi:hypothetical protein